MSSFPIPPDPPRLDKAGREWLGKAAAQALERHCRGLGAAETPSPPEVLVPPDVHTRAGVFVTLFHRERLRGCLGAARSTDPLSESVPRLAVAAATRDTRFAPLEARELSGVRIEITVLGELTLLPAAPEAVLAGLNPPLHGVCLRRGDRTALLLPQVARRLDWGALELLRQLSLKAGLGRDAWRESGTELSAFLVVSFSGDAFPREKDPA